MRQLSAARAAPSPAWFGLILMPMLQDVNDYIRSDA
jgi:hypothetical protein